MLKGTYYAHCNVILNPSGPLLKDSIHKKLHTYGKQAVCVLCPFWLGPGSLISSISPLTLRCSLCIIISLCDVVPLQYAMPFIVWHVILLFVLCTWEITQRQKNVFTHPGFNLWMPSDTFCLSAHMRACVCLCIRESVCVCVCTICPKELYTKTDFHVSIPF